MTAPAIKAILFDKDGTLFDFDASWAGYFEDLLARETGGDADRMRAIADHLAYDPVGRRFLPGSVVIAETVDIVADHMLPFLPETTKAALIDRMNALSADLRMTEIVPLAPLLDQLSAMGLPLGVCTNDAETPARAQLALAGVEDRFAFIAGHDSGYTPKPAPDAPRAFCRAVGLPPQDCLMVGDSLHDLIAGRAAGMQTAFLTDDPARAPDIADITLRHIGELPDRLRPGRAGPR